MHKRFQDSMMHISLHWCVFNVTWFYPIDEPLRKRENANLSIFRWFSLGCLLKHAGEEINWPLWCHKRHWNLSQFPYTNPRQVAGRFALSLYSPSKLGEGGAKHPFSQEGKMWQYKDVFRRNLSGNFYKDLFDSHLEAVLKWVLWIHSKKKNIWAYYYIL